MKAAYSAHQITRDQFHALNNSVIVEDMEFDVRITQTGLILPNDNGKSSGIRPRWAKVYAIGPDQQDVRVGEWICVAHGRWTRGLDIEDETGKHTIRKIDPKDILMSADERPDDLTFSDAIHVEKKQR
jgi:NOL1/NOP2/fmu family ribosome biogenesis protein